MRFSNTPPPRTRLRPRYLLTTVFLKTLSGFCYIRG
jgi:hypothetical protein